MDVGLPCPINMPWIARREDSSFRDIMKSERDMAAQVWSQVIKEPVVREADVSTRDNELQLDLGIRGARQPQVKRALFDIKVIDTDAPSHRNRSPESVLESGAKENV